MRLLLVTSSVMALLSFIACDKGGGSRGDPGAATGTTSTTPKDPGGTGSATGLEFSPFAVTSIYTSDTADNSCVTFTVKAVKDGSPSADVGITLTVDSTMSDKGVVSPDSGVTGADGLFKSSYCAGKIEGMATVSAKTGALSANSSKVTVKKKATYLFAYARADITDSKPEDQTLYLNTLDSGPNDCSIIYFKLSKTGVGIIGASVDFTTQVDYPASSKLAKKTDPAVTDTDAKTGKKYAKYTAVSSGAGEFAVPVCAGVSLGSILISGSWTDTEEKKVYTVRSPVVRITSGLTNYINYSLSFDALNARTLRAFYNTNSEFDLSFSVALGARFDGQAIDDYPVSIATEVGRYTLKTGGFLDEKTNSVPVSLHALHLVDNYPYPVKKFWDGNAANNIYPLAQTRCEPNQIAAWIKDKNAGVALSYDVLRKNWQSAMVYAVRGQEYFYDANHNGVYDIGGTGFWDKNQNGIYDSGDVITYPVGGTFDATSEWFVDLPTPFVDVDDDMVFTEGVDFPLGEKYQAPNGKRDADALIWKKENFPISMGPSYYSLSTNLIKADGAGVLLAPDHLYSGAGVPSTSRFVYGQAPIRPAYIFDSLTDAGQALGGSYNFINFIHDICGNVLPGGTMLSWAVTDIYTPSYGIRTPKVYYTLTPGDEYLEPTRKLLSKVSGSSATVNFNTIDHPAGPLGYPAQGSIEVPACSKACTGLVSVAGVACDSYVGELAMTVKEPSLDQTGSVSTTILKSIAYPAIKTCSCIAGTYLNAGVCACPEGTSFDSVSATCKLN